MSVSTGGGWFISTIGADSSYNAFCYAGNGCSVIDLYDSTPLDVLKMDQVEQHAVNFGRGTSTQEEGEASCISSRVDDRSLVSDPRTLCPSGVTPGSVRLCRMTQSTNQILLCGETSILAFQTDKSTPTQEQVVIEQHAISNLDLLSARTPGGVYTDGDCVTVGSKIYCEPGMTWLFAFPSGSSCEGNIAEDLLAFTCPDNGRGFTFTGCCSSGEGEEEGYTLLPTEAPTAHPAQANNDQTESASPPSEGGNNADSSTPQPGEGEDEPIQDGDGDEVQVTSDTSSASLFSSVALSQTLAGIAVGFVTLFVIY